MVCSWHTDKEIGRYHVPDCWGGAIYGPEVCYCDREKEAQSLEDRVSELERQVSRLTSPASAR